MRMCAKRWTNLSVKSSVSLEARPIAGEKQTMDPCLRGWSLRMLREDRWTETGVDIEQWIAKAAASAGCPAVLHSAAARVLERPIDRLWPLGPAA